MPIIPSDATHVNQKTGRYFKLVSITPLKVMWWTGYKWQVSEYSNLPYSKFLKGPTKIKPKFKGNTHGQALQRL